LDAVHSRVRALGGSMDIRSEPGEGTTMMLKLPLTLAIVRALLARVADETYAIPLAHVSDTIEVTPEIVKTVKGREVLLARDEVLPLHRMRELVDLPAYVAPNEIALEQAVVIKVSDDGRGIDRKRVLARARRDGLVDAAKQDLTEDELLWLLARPGFSTAEKVTDLSGRGVGVDAVHTRVRALGGAMNLRSVPGEGTTMTLRLPLTLAIVRALLARVGGETYAIPLAHVSETMELTRDIVRTVKGREVLIARDGMLPLLRLRRLVALPAFQPSSDIDLEQVVVIDLGDRRAGLVIDELTGQEEIVVKQFDAVRDGLPFFGGATLLGDGTPSLIVDAGSLF
jgi:chemotaxis protein histidine kinase CheA